MSNKPIGYELYERRAAERSRLEEIERVRKEVLQRQEDERLLPQVEQLYNTVLNFAQTNWDSNLTEHGVLSYYVTKNDPTEAKVWEKVAMKLWTDAQFKHAIYHTNPQRIDLRFE